MQSQATSGRKVITASVTGNNNNNNYYYYYLPLEMSYCITNNFLCIIHTVEHNNISPSSTVGIQLHVSALCVGHLQVVI